MSFANFLSGIGDFAGDAWDGFTGIFDGDGAAPAPVRKPAPLAAPQAAPVQAPSPMMEAGRGPMAPAPVMPHSPLKGEGSMDAARASAMRPPMGAPQSAPVVAPAPAPRPERTYQAPVPGRALGGALSASPGQMGNAYLQRLIRQKQQKKADMAAAAPLWEQYRALEAEGYNSGGRVGADQYGSPAQYRMGGGRVDADTYGSPAQYHMDGGRVHADQFGAPAQYREDGGSIWGNIFGGGLVDRLRGDVVDANQQRADDINWATGGDNLAVQEAAPAAAPAPASAPAQSEYAKQLEGLSAEEFLAGQDERLAAARAKDKPWYAIWENDGGLVDFAKQEALNYALPQSSIYGRLGSALGGAAGLFNHGGPIGSGLRNVKELQTARQSGALSQKEYLEALKYMPQMKNDGGQINKLGPLGGDDLVKLGKGRDISKVKYKKAGGKVTDELEVSYHNPYASAGKTDQ